MTHADPAIPMLGDPAEITTPGARQFLMQRNCPSSPGLSGYRTGALQAVIWVREYSEPAPWSPCGDHRHVLVVQETLKYWKQFGARSQACLACTCQGEFIE